MSKFTLGIDMGGTGIKVALVDQKGKIHQSSRLPTPLKATSREIIAPVVELARAVIRQIGKEHIKGIGVGCAGDIDSSKGVVRMSPNLLWKNVPLKRMLLEQLHVPILVDNDANVAAWAAYVVEAKRRVSNLLCVTVGTGVGGGLVIDGKLYHGATGSAGELGHMTLCPNGVPCPCGNQGCTERYVGSKAMCQEAVLAIKSGTKSLLSTQVHGDWSKLSPHIIQKAARAGDSLALHLWEQAGTRLGTTLASVVNLLNPEWIVIAGGLSRAGPLLLQPLKRTILERSFHTPARAVKLVISRLDQDLGMVGAGLLAHELFR